MVTIFMVEAGFIAVLPRWSISGDVLPTSRTYKAVALAGTPALRIASMIGLGNAACDVVALAALTKKVARAPLSRCNSRKNISARRARS